MRRLYSIVLVCGLLSSLAGPVAAASPADLVTAEEVRLALENTTGDKTAQLGSGWWQGEVFVLPYSYGTTYDREVGGLSNVLSRQWVSQSFFAAGPGRYDFVVVFTDFEFSLGTDTIGLYWSVANDVEGIGLDLFDLGPEFGSQGLQGYIDANQVDHWLSQDGELNEEGVLEVLQHELGHRWLAYCSYLDGNGTVSSALLGRDDAHWSYLLDSEASVMYGSRWEAAEDGTFTATEVRARYSHLDLYLMGMLAEHEVPPFTLLVNPAVDAGQLPLLGATIAAQPETVDVGQVVAAEGPRRPVADETQREFRIAIVYLVTPGAGVDPEKLAHLERVRGLWQRSHFRLTGGRGVVDVGRNSTPPGDAVRLDLNAAADWLAAAGGSGGLWQETAATTVRDTVAAVTALSVHGSHADSVNAGLNALGFIPQAATELEARRVELLGGSLGAAAVTTDALLDAAQPLGGWGASQRFHADTVTTARVVRALEAAGDQASAAAGWTWLESVQNPDGGWGWRPGAPSHVYPTVEVLCAARHLSQQLWSSAAVSGALEWLLPRQSGGGFGEPFADVPQTALFLQAVFDRQVNQDAVEGAITFLSRHQSRDGSWEQSIAKTAMAVAALAPHAQPDLAVSSDELVADPQRPYEGDTLDLYAAVRNFGTDLAAGAGYRWELVDSVGVAATLAGSLPALAQDTFVTISDQWPLTVAPGQYTLSLVVDPDQEVTEKDETNNLAATALEVRAHPAGVDLVLTGDRVELTPAMIAQMPQPLVVSGVVDNLGLSDASGVVVAVTDKGTGAALGSQLVDVPGLGSAGFLVNVVLDEARPHTLVVTADPDDLWSDADRSNNSVERVLSVANAADLEVEPGSFLIDPASGTVGDAVTLRARVHNRGTMAVEDLQVAFSFVAGDPPETSPIVLQVLDGELAPNGSRDVETVWHPNVAGTLTVNFAVDPNQLVPDVERSNNLAAATLTMATSALPNLAVAAGDLSFDPDPARQGTTCRISGRVSNVSDNAAGAFAVQVWLDDPDTGTLLAETPVAGLGPGGTTQVEAFWLVDRPADTMVWLVVDAAAAVDEFNEDDNRAFTVLDVHSLPDLVVTSGQVTVEPAFPHSGEEVRLGVEVVNTGDQEARNVRVELVDPQGVVLDATVLARVAGGARILTELTWATGTAVGEVPLEVVVNSTHAVEELSYDNNRVSVPVAVQDAELYVSHRYFSPNGDGVLDSTGIYFRANVESIQVEDRDGEVVRELVVPQGASSVQWDGMNDAGSVVRDGPYQVTAAQLTTWVVVDNNRTKITDDVTQRLLVGSIEKTMPYSGWGEDHFESAIASPIEGEVFLLEVFGMWSPEESWKLQRHSGFDLIEVGDFPSQYTSLRGAAASGDLFLASRWGSQWALVSYPGPVVEPITPPSGYYGEGEVMLSPDGEWILWGDSGDGDVTLQRTDDPGVTYSFGSFNLTGQPCGYVVTWSPDSRRAVVSAPGEWDSRPYYLVVTIGDPPQVERLEPGDWPEGAGCTGGVEPSKDGRSDQVALADGPTGLQVAVDWVAAEMTWLDAYTGEVVVFDLVDGSPTEAASIDFGWDPWMWPDLFLSTDGRAVLARASGGWGDRKDLYDGNFLYDWRNDVAQPMEWSSWGAEWSPYDKFLYSELGTDVESDGPEYRTPAANLTVDLKASVLFGNAGVGLRVLVTDRHLDRYLLEYAPDADELEFVPIGVPGREPLYGSSWGTWLPPAKGRYALRLTAYDLAGNERSRTVWVSWNGEHDIANLWREPRHISPLSSPGVQDELLFHYTVLRPANLVFDIVDSDGELVRRIPVAASEPGQMTTSWDGTDQAGRPVADGDYALSYEGATWPVTVDNTPPEVMLSIGDNQVSPDPELVEAAASTCNIRIDRDVLANTVLAAVDDANLVRWVWQTRTEGNPVWWTLRESVDPFDSSDPEEPFEKRSSEWWVGREVRLVASDLAGNESVAARLHREERLAFALSEPGCRFWTDDPCRYPERPEIDAVGDAGGRIDRSAGTLQRHYNTLLVQAVVWGDWRQSLSLQYRVPETAGFPAGEWQPGELVLAQTTLRRTPLEILIDDEVCRTRRASFKAEMTALYWDHPELPMRPYEVRLVAVNRDGATIVSPTTLLTPPAPLSLEYLGTDAAGDHFRVTNIGLETLTDIQLRIDSFDAFPVVSRLEPGYWALVDTQCSLLEIQVQSSRVLLILSAEGKNPYGVLQVSRPLRFDRGPTFSDIGSSLSASSCVTGRGPAHGIKIFDAQGNGWFSGAWFAPGNEAALGLSVPSLDPTGLEVAGWELLLDGNVVASSDEVAPGTGGQVRLDLSQLPAGGHLFSERYHFAGGQLGMLSSCAASKSLTVDRQPPQLEIVDPAEGEVLCPDQGMQFISVSVTDDFAADGLIEKHFYLDDRLFYAWRPGDRDYRPYLDVASVEPGEHELRVMVVDAAGNSTCRSIHVLVPDLATIKGLGAAPEVFSPVNTLGKPTFTEIGFTADSPGEYVLEIRDSVGDTVQSTAGSVSYGEHVVHGWDGYDFVGSLVPDGIYSVRAELRSPCGAVYTASIPNRSVPRGVEVDTTPPNLVVTAPQPAEVVGSVMEIRGLVNDRNFASWRAEVREAGACDTCWQEVAAGRNQTTEAGDVIRSWSTVDFEPGDYDLRIVADDVPGNRASFEVAFTIRERRFIASFERDPQLISPNWDGAADACTIEVSLIQDALLTLVIEDAAEQPVAILLDRELHGVAEGIIAVPWYGTDDSGDVVADAPYTITLVAEDPVDPPQLEPEQESLGVTVDTTPPEVEIGSPMPGLFGLPLDVRLSATDLHPEEFLLNLLGPDGAEEWLAQGTMAQDRLAAVLVDRPDGDYRLTLDATDAAGNFSSVEREFTVDNTQPAVRITSPQAGAVIDTMDAPVPLRGMVTSAHPRQLVWAYAAGDAPAEIDFIEISSGPLEPVDGPVALDWDASALADGTYTVRLLVTDQLDRRGEARQVFEADATAPLVRIDLPVNGAVVSGPQDITGEVADVHLEAWRLEAVPASDASLSRVLTRGTSPASGGLTTWSLLPPDGECSLKLWARDRAGNESQTEVLVTIAVTPPGPPTDLTATVVNRQDVALAWLPGEGPAPAGYHVFRDGVRLTPAPVPVPSYLDSTVAEGVHAYHVIAVDTLGRDSDPSNTATVLIDITPPIVRISAPAAGDRVSGEVPVYGMAYEEERFRDYLLHVRWSGGDWILLAHGTAPVVADQLGVWQAGGGDWFDGDYELRLEAWDTFGNSASDSVTVQLDNQPPVAPVLVEATAGAQGGDGLVNDVHLTWLLDPSPADLAGFYLYRNELLANAPGPVIGSQTPYLLPGLSYDDTDLPDGTYVYWVTAADTADNESPASNPSDPIVIDVRRPHAVIVDPPDGTSFEGSTTVVAECEDNDLVSLQFEYRLASASDWLALGAPFAAPPFEIEFAPADTGTYLVRAVAADATGPDPAPEAVSLTAADLPPEAPVRLSARVDGGTVTLTWLAPPDPLGDLAGYHVERDGARLTTDPLAPGVLTWVDDDMADGVYRYSVLAVDEAGQEGDPAGPETARVWTPRWAWLQPVSEAAARSLYGSNVSDEETVRLELRDGGGQFHVVRSTSGNGFAFPDQPVQLGLNVFRARSMDADGNRSKPSRLLTLLRHDPPAAPQELAAQVLGNDVSLSWTAGPDPDSAGFRVHRDGVLVNENVTAHSFDAGLHQLAASSGAAADWLTVVDGDPLTGWTPDAVPTAATPASWSWTWTGAVELERVRITWSGDEPHFYELELRAGGEWLWWQREWPSAAINEITAGLAVTGIRLYLDEPAYCGASACVPTLAEVEAFTADRTTAHGYVDPGVAAGGHNWAVSQRNDWGQESDQVSVAAVVAVPPPAPPTSLSVVPADGCSGLDVSWQPPPELPAVHTGYRLYRGEAAGGPYAAVTTVAPGTLQFLDISAAIGHQYFYVATTLAEVDGIAVESAASVEASGVFTCADAPPPVITSPTVAGQPVNWPYTVADIAGTALSSSTVRLLADGTEVASLDVPVASEPELFQLPGFSYGRASFDSSGGLVAYEEHVGWRSHVVVRDLASGSEVRFDRFDSSMTPALSPDGGLVACGVYSGGWQEIVLFGVADGSMDFLTSGGRDSSDPVFSADGRYLFWIAEQWDPFWASFVIRHDLATGVTTEVADLGSLSLSSPVLSPDGAWLVGASGEGSLAIVDLGDGTWRTLSGGMPRSVTTSPFSRDGSSFLFTQGEPWDPTTASLWRYDLDGGAVQGLSASSGEFGAAYLDATSVVHLVTDGSTVELVLRSLVDGSLQTLLDGLEERPFIGQWLHVAATGTILLTQNQQIWSLDLAGRFEFRNVALHEGSNFFVARQVAAGDTLDSEPIEIIVDAALYADAEVVGVTAYPTFAERGETVLVEALVANRGQAALVDCPVELVLIPPEGLPETLLAQTLSLPPGGSASVTTAWDTTAVLGDLVWQAQADPYLQVAELDETNNLARTTVYVRESRQVELAAELDRERYFNGDTAFLDVDFMAGAAPQDYTLRTVIEDHGGALVDVADERELVGFGYSSTSFTVAWYVDGIYPGSYRARVVAVSNGDQVAEAVVDFEVRAERYATARVWADRTAYRSGSEVVITGRVGNAAASYLEGATAHFRIEPSAGGVAGFLERQVATLGAGGSVDLGWTWSSAGFGDGLYRVHLEVRAEDGELLATAEPFLFRITDQTVLLAGELQVEPFAIEPGDAAAVQATVTNNGPSTLEGVALRLGLVDPVAASELDASSEVARLVPGGQRTLAWQPDTSALELDDLVVVLTASGSHAGEPFEETLATATLHVADLSPPAVTVLSPQPGLVCGPVDLEVEAVDAITGVHEVSFRIDSEDGRRPIPLLAPLSATPRYGGITWTLRPEQDGLHEIVFDATDMAGNTCDPVPVLIDADLLPPVLSALLPDEGACLGVPAVATFSAQDARLDRVVATLDGQPYLSGQAIAADGSHELVVEVADACGRQAGASSRFVVDRTEPQIQVQGVEDGGSYRTEVELSWTVSDANLTGETALLDGEAVSSPVVVTAKGSHQLVLTAGDCAGNEASLSLAFSVTDSSPEEHLAAVAGIEVPGGAVLLWDRAPAGSAQYADWLGQHCGVLRQVTEACDALTELRSGRWDAVVVVVPEPAEPVDLGGCTAEADCAQLATELSAFVHVGGGLLVAGGDSDDCLGSALLAAGTRWEALELDRVEPEATTGMVVPEPGSVLFDVRALDPDEAFPILLATAGGAPLCDGITGLSLAWPLHLGAGDWQVDSGVASPYQELDTTSGVLTAGGSLEDGTASWVRTSVERDGARLLLHLETTGGDVLPRWLHLELQARGSAGEVAEVDAWLQVSCALSVGDPVGDLVVENVEPLQHGDLDRVVAAARRYGRGESLVLPWEVEEPANRDGLDLNEQALQLLTADRERRLVSGMPVPVAVVVHNLGEAATRVMVELDVPSELVDGFWPSPDQPGVATWSFVISAGEQRLLVAWVRPTVPLSDLDVQWTASYRDQAQWFVFASGEVDLATSALRLADELRACVAVLGECGRAADDPAVAAILHQVRAELGELDPLRRDRAAAEEALARLSQAFTATEDEAAPCVAELRLRLSRLIARWQRLWLEPGGER